MGKKEKSKKSKGKSRDKEKKEKKEGDEEKLSSKVDGDNGKKDKDENKKKKRKGGRKSKESKKDAQKGREKPKDLGDSRIDISQEAEKKEESSVEKKKSFDKKNKSSKTESKSGGLIGFLKKPIHSRKACLIISFVFIFALLVVMADLALCGSYPGPQSNFSFSNSKVEKKKEPELTHASPLSGMMTTKKKAERAVVGVMVENHTAARPQSGLDKAGLVYEALAEGGITRFLAFFLSSDADPVGPIRSARSYYLPWAKELGAFYAHIGGSKEAFDLIDEYGLEDIDQFYNSTYFWRDSSRFAPHNLYSTTTKLRQAGVDKGWANQNNFVTWQFQDENPTDKKPVKDIQIDFSGSNFLVEYDYNKKKNVYTRYLAQSPHRTLKGNQIAPKNILVQVVDQYLSSDGVHMEVENIGSGEAYLFRDGRVFKGTWEKKSVNSRTKFYRPNGREFEFARGQIWVHIIPSANRLTY